MQEPTAAYEHTHAASQPELRIKLERGQRGGYGWEVSASAPGHDVEALLGVIDEVDSELRRRYSPTEETRARAA